MTGYVSLYNRGAARLVLPKIDGGFDPDFKESSRYVDSGDSVSIPLNKWETLRKHGVVRRWIQSGMLVSTHNPATPATIKHVERLDSDPEILMPSVVGEHAQNSTVRRTDIMKDMYKTMEGNPLLKAAENVSKGPDQFYEDMAPDSSAMDLLTDKSRVAVPADLPLPTPEPKSKQPAKRRRK